MTPSQRRPRRRAGILPVLFVLALASAAEAQTPILTLQATPSPFGPGTSIAITAEVALNAPVESFCDPAPPTYCAVQSIFASVQVTGSNGFSDAQDSWTEWAWLQTSDPGPGQTLQATTYTANGIVVVTHCRVNPIDPIECAEPPQDYVEEGVPIQAVVHPIPPPSLSSVSPSVAVVGSFVEVHGAHFGTSGTLTFNGAAAAGYDLLEWTSTRIQAFVPGGATSGAVVVTTGNQPSPGVTMTVTPHIALLTPGSGAVGQSVTITGTGFGSSGAVTFNGVAATSISSWTSTSVTVLVPSGATSGAVVVTVAGVPSTGKSFIVTSGSPAITETIQYYHTDAIGSVRLITDAGGQVVATNDYLPFGDDWQPTGDLDPRGFAQMERTPNTGVGTSWGPLNYAGARYYHSQTGRFTSPDDPSYLDPLNPQTWNLYQYALNNPLRWVDPLGLAPEPPGPPPNPVPPGRSGAPNSWRKNEKNGRWEPREPLTTPRGPSGRGGPGQPHVSWDEEDEWWRLIPGDRTRKRHFWPDGTPAPSRHPKYGPPPDTFGPDPLPWWWPDPESSPEPTSPAPPPPSLPWWWWRLPFPLPIIFSPCMVEPFLPGCVSNPGVWGNVHE